VRLDCGEPRSGCPAAFLCVSSRLEDARPSAYAPLDADPRTRDRATPRSPLRLPRQRARRRRLKHLLRDVWYPPYRTRLVQIGRMDPRRRRALSEVRRADGGRHRRTARNMGPPPSAGPAERLRTRWSKAQSTDRSERKTPCSSASAETLTVRVSQRPLPSRLPGFLAMPIGCFDRLAS